MHSDMYKIKRVENNKIRLGLLIYRLRDYNFEHNKKLLKGERRMPRLLWAKKDVVSCEKLRGFANEI